MNHHSQVQLAWKGAGRLILEEKEKLLREGQLYQTAGLSSPGHHVPHGTHLLSHNPHLNLSESHSEPFAAAVGHRVSPSIRNGLLLNRT